MIHIAPLLTMSTNDNSSKLNSLNYTLKLDDENMEKEILKPFKHLTTVPGKKIRQNLVTILQYWAVVPEDKLPKIENLIHIIHSTSLLLDDIQDHSNLRRGIPTAHKIYGIPRTLFAVNWLQGESCELLNQLDNIELTKTYANTIKEVIAGQGMELYWRDNYICPSEKEYLQMIYRKTGLIFLLAQRAMNTFSTSKQVVSGNLLTALGMYFQINDDYQNLHNEKYFDSKGFCEDLTEGKFSYPVIHAINNFPKETEVIKDALQKRTRDVELKKRCLEILEKCGSFEYTRTKLNELKSVIYSEIANMDDYPLIADFIQTAMAAESEISVWYA